MAKRKPKSRIELLIEELRVADLRLRLVNDLGRSHRGRAIAELREAQKKLNDIVMDTLLGDYNG